MGESGRQLETMKLGLLLANGDGLAPQVKKFLLRGDSGKPEYKSGSNDEPLPFCLLPTEAITRVVEQVGWHSPPLVLCVSRNCLFTHHHTTYRGRSPALLSGWIIEL
jgi:hypothetical protein